MGNPVASKRAITDSDDLNNISENGVYGLYRVHPSNLPTLIRGDFYGNLVVFGQGSYRQQQLFSYDGKQVFSRGLHNDGRTWKQIGFDVADSAELASVVAGQIGFPLGNNSANFYITSGSCVKFHLTGGMVLIGGAITAGGANFLVGVGGYEPGTSARIRAKSIINSTQDVYEIYLNGSDVYIKNIGSSSMYCAIICFGVLSAQPEIVKELPSGTQKLTISL